KVLPGAGLGVLGTRLKEGLVGVPVDVTALERPVLLVDVVLDQTLELCRVLDLVLCLAEDQAEGAGLVAKVFEQVTVGDLQVVTVVVDQVLPAAVLPSRSVGEDALRVEATVLPLVRHLQEEQEGELFDVVD